MRIALIILSTVTLVAFSEAHQRKPNITKPTVNLEKRPRPPVWHKPPEERRKLSIFPKTNTRFVITPKPIQNVNEAKEGLPTKRPLMRKFVMRDKDDKESWSFAPREPLMKPHRFTVTLAPPKYNNREENDEIQAEESQKVYTVVRKVKFELGSTTVRNINKGNLINTVPIKTSELPVSKSLQKLEQNFTESNTSQVSNGNNMSTIGVFQSNDNNRLHLSDKTPAEYLIDVRSLNDDGIALDAHETIKEERVLNTFKSDKEMKTAIKFNTDESDALAQNSAVDSKEMEHPIHHIENDSLPLDNKDTNNYNPQQLLSFNDLEILLEKIVNHTEKPNMYSTGLHYNESFSTPSNQTNNETIEYIPQIDINKPNSQYDVKSFRNEEIPNLKTGTTVGSIIQDSLAIINEKKHDVRETNPLIVEEDFNENVADTLVVSWNLENLFNLVGNKSFDYRKSGSNETKDILISDNTEKVTTRQNVDTELTSILTAVDIQDESKMESSKAFMSNDSVDSNSQNISLEIYESNISLSEEDSSTESLADEDSREDFYESASGNLTNEASTNEEFIDNSNSLCLDGNSSEPISDASNNFTEEQCNESLIESSNNLTNEEMSNESYSNVAGEELSNESYVDQSINLTGETSNESFIGSFVSVSDDTNSNESSSIMTGEDLTNESYADNRSNLTVEISESESEMELGNVSSGEQTFDESSSNLAGEKSHESISIEDSSEVKMVPPSNTTREIIPNTSASDTEDARTSNRSHLTEGISEKINDTLKNISVSEISQEPSIDDSTIHIDERIGSDKVIIGSHSESSSGEKVAEEALANRFKRSKSMLVDSKIRPEVRLNHDLIYTNINA